MAGMRSAWSHTRITVQHLVKSPLHASQQSRPQPKLSRCCQSAVRALPMVKAASSVKATARCMCLQVVPALDSVTAHALGCGWGEQSSKSDLAKLCVLVVRSLASCM